MDRIHATALALNLSSSETTKNSVSLISLFRQIGILPCLSRNLCISQSFYSVFYPNILSKMTQKKKQVHLFLIGNLVIWWLEQKMWLLAQPYHHLNLGLGHLSSPFVFVWAAFTKYHRLDGLSNRNIFLIVLGAEKSKIRVSARSVSGRGPLPGLQMAVFLLCPHLAKRERSSLSCFFL